MLSHVPFSRSIKTFIKERQQEKAENKSGWIFSRSNWLSIRDEMPDWLTHYLPIDLRGKTVLDVGARQGETAKLFLEHGAAQVICVECDPEQIKYLQANAKLHKELVVIPKPFSLDMLQYPFDFMKMDIEGHEECLRGVTLVKPAVLEVHGLPNHDYFKAAGWRMANVKETPYWWLCYGYWHCSSDNPKETKEEKQ